MQNLTVDTSKFANQTCKDVLTELLREKACQMLAAVIEAEADEWINQHRNVIDEQGKRLVVRNGHLPTRNITTGIGQVKIRQPRIRDNRSAENRERFTSCILPPYLRRTKSIEELLPWLYLRGISTGDFNQALQSLLGPDCPGLSAPTITRLKESWNSEYKTWQQRDLSNLRIVYLWADGIHFNIRLGEQDKQCILVLMGADENGKKHLLGLCDGYSESEQNWRCLLADLKRRGLSKAPKLATADGGLGFWAALPKVWSNCREQRCWVHKTANVLRHFPKRLQAQAKSALHQIWMAPCRRDAEIAFDRFILDYQAKYPKAAKCLEKDREKLLCFYDFPAEHWVHIRTTNPIESTFSTVRLRTVRTKHHGSPLACLAMVFKLCECAAKRWRVLNGSKLLPEVLSGVKFVDGLKSAA